MMTFQALWMGSRRPVPGARPLVAALYGAPGGSNFK
jgi:hypothetical protein